MVHDYPLVPDESVISEVFAPPDESAVTGKVSKVFAPPGESMLAGEPVVSEVFATPGEARPESKSSHNFEISMVMSWSKKRTRLSTEITRFQSPDSEINIPGSKYSSQA